jgi:chaperone modulatory protein CbpM
MMTLEQLSVSVRVDRGRVTHWVEAGWLLPEETDGDWQFTDIDIARARLIRDLVEAFEVNEAAVPVILDLIDQRQALEARMRDLFQSLGEESEQVRRAVLSRCLENRRR